jgi:hypothetical protein
MKHQEARVRWSVRELNERRCLAAITPLPEQVLDRHVLAENGED